jgi:hypothetical protein
MSDFFIRDSSKLIAGLAETAIGQWESVPVRIPATRFPPLKISSLRHFYQVATKANESWRRNLLRQAENANISVLVDTLLRYHLWMLTQILLEAFSSYHTDIRISSLDNHDDPLPSVLVPSILYCSGFRSNAKVPPQPAHSSWLRGDRGPPYLVQPHGGIQARQRKACSVSGGMW